MVCSRIYTINLGQIGDLPKALLIFGAHQRSCDPVAVDHACRLAAGDRGNIFIPVVYQFYNIILDHFSINVNTFLAHFISCDVSFSFVVHPVSAAGLDHHHDRVAACRFAGQQVLAGLLVNVFADLHKSGPCDVCQIVNRVSRLIQDIRAVAGNTSAVVKRNAVVHAVLHGISLLQCAEIIPVDVHAAQIREGIRIAQQKLLVAVILHQNDIRHRAVVAGIRAGRQLGLTVVRGSLDHVDRKSRMVFRILLSRHVHRLDVKGRIPCPDGQRIAALGCCCRLTCRSCLVCGRCPPV